MSQQADEMKALMRAAREARVEVDLLLECVQRRIISIDRGWDASAIDQARRVRRLMSLGVNLPGIEVIVHMRRRTLQMQREMDRIHQEMERMRRAHEQEITRLLRELSKDVQNP
ncbi:MAG: hypothetical protein M3220_20150 [Chloroflexota bacterium]|nr:hypothetical protein [Chloroflexota bacterium]